MFGMGMPEILLILAIALIVIGPKKLPDLAKSMGKAFGEFKRATQDFKQALDVDNDVRTVKRTFDDIDLSKIADTAPPRPEAETGDEAAQTAEDASGPETPSSPETDTTPPDNADAAAEKDSGTDRHA